MIFITLFLMIAVGATSCGDSQEDSSESNQSAITAGSAASNSTIYTDKVLKSNLDSLVDEICKIGASTFFSKIISKEVLLTEEYQMERPEYLMPLSKAAQATTMGKKYRAAVIFKADMIVAAAYHKPLSDYKQTIARLLVDINNPGFNINLNESHRRSAKAIRNMINELYNEAYKQNSVNLFWE